MYFALRQTNCRPGLLQKNGTKVATPTSTVITIYDNLDKVPRAYSLAYIYYCGVDWMERAKKLSKQTKKTKTKARDEDDVMVRLAFFMK